MDANLAADNEVDAECMPRSSRKGKRKMISRQTFNSKTNSSLFTATPALKAARTRAWKTYEGFSQEEINAQFPATSFVTLRFALNGPEPVEMSSLAATHEENSLHELHGRALTTTTCNPQADMTLINKLADEQRALVNGNEMSDDVGANTPRPPHSKRQRHSDNQSMELSRSPTNQNKRPRESTKKVQTRDFGNYASLTDDLFESPLYCRAKHLQPSSFTTNRSPDSNSITNGQVESNCNFLSSQSPTIQAKQAFGPLSKRNTLQPATGLQSPHITIHTFNHSIAEEENDGSQSSSCDPKQVRVVAEGWFGQTINNLQESSNINTDCNLFSPLLGSLEPEIEIPRNTPESVTLGRPTHLALKDFRAEQSPKYLSFCKMAPVRDPNSVEGALKDAVQTLYEVQSQVHGFVPETQPLLIDKMTELARSLAHLQTITSPTSSSNNPIHKYHVAPEIIDYVDDSRNPDIYNREFVELVQRGNAVLNGKQKAFRDFSEIFAQALKEGFDGMDQQVDRIMSNASLADKTTDKMNSEGGPANGANKS